MNKSLYVGRSVYEHRSVSSALWVAATWPFQVLELRTCVAYGQGELANMPFFSVKTAKKILSLVYREARDMLQQGARQGLFPGLFAGLVTYQLDWMVKEIVGSILMDQQDVATAMDRRQRVLSALNRRIDVLNVMDPERAALSSVRATLDEYTPLQLTLRSMLANLASTAVAATVTYPLRVLTYKMICGQVSGPNAAWNMVTDRDQHTTTLWKGYPYYLCASLLGSVIQQGINYGIAQVYDEIDGAVCDDGEMNSIEKPMANHGAAYFTSCVAAATLGAIFLSPLSSISIHQRLGLGFTPSFKMGTMAQMFFLGVSNKPALDQ